VVLVFFNPAGETADLAVAIASALHDKYAGRAAIVALAVWKPLTRAHRNANVPIYDGTQADTAYGIDSVPRFLLLDAAGVVRSTFSGVGAETGFSTREQLDLLLTPVVPNPAPGTTRPPGPGNGVMAPRP
jgi:hypothetical protein